MYLLNACGWFATYKGQGMATPHAMARAARFLLITGALEGGLELGLRAAHSLQATITPSITMTTSTTGVLQQLAVHALVVWARARAGGWARANFQLRSSGVLARCLC